jgi:hypothetical protein
LNTAKQKHKKNKNKNDDDDLNIFFFSGLNETFFCPILFAD